MLKINNNDADLVKKKTTRDIKRNSNPPALLKKKTREENICQFQELPRIVAIAAVFGSLSRY